MDESGHETSIQSIARELQRKTAERSNIVLFLGSRSGSLFRRPLLGELLAPIERFPIERFQKCHSILSSRDSDALIVIGKALEDARRVEVADTCLAELIKHHIFTTVLTTNIGCELELAFIQCDMVKQSLIASPLECEVIYHWSSLQPINMSPDASYSRNAIRVFKIFGDFGSKEYTVNNGPEYLEQHPEIKHILEQVQDSNMLVVGFDEVWDKHVKSRLFTRKSGKFWYVNEEKPKDNTFLSLILQEKSNASIFGVEGSYEIFFLNLCWHILGTIPTYQVTLDKLTRLEKDLQIVRDTQQAIQHEVGALTRNVDTLLGFFSSSPISSSSAPSSTSRVFPIPPLDKNSDILKNESTEEE